MAKTTYFVDNLPYIGVTPNRLKKGDLVFDKGDETVAVVDGFINDTVTLRGNGVIEIGVPLYRLRKLIPAINNLLN